MSHAGDIGFTLNGERVSVPDDGCSLLEALRDRLGVRSPKDGCSPQGQCGCCTVWLDDQPRLACVTPLVRVGGRVVTTLEGLSTAPEWADRLCAVGGSQCGFCTPGIVMRLAVLAPPGSAREEAVRQALLAHLCRCTGWQTVVDAACRESVIARRDRSGSARRAQLEGGADQLVGEVVALGGAGFAADSAPAGSLVAVLADEGDWVVAATLTEARRRAGKVQGRRSTAPLRWPVELPDGDFVRTLRTTWVEPAYVEPDAAWCLPGGEPVGPLINGGAFGGKVASEVGAAARHLAGLHDCAVLAVYSREDVVRRGPKRPPIAAGVRADGTGVIRVVRTEGIADAIRSVTPQFQVEEVDVPGPLTSVALRGAGWVEATVLLAPSDGWVRSPAGGCARADVSADGSIIVAVDAGAPLDETVLRSYCTGAAHMALGWVRREGIAVAADGAALDLTIRSFGVLRATETPSIEVRIHASAGEPVNGSDAVFAAVALAAWRHSGFAPRWPTMRS